MPKNHKKKQKKLDQKSAVKALFGDGFWTMFGAFLANFKAQNTVKSSIFAILVLKVNNVKCCNNRVNTDVFEGPCAENCKYRGFWRNMQKKCKYRVLGAFWLNNIDIYSVFGSLSADNCINSMVLEVLDVFGPLGNRDLWYVQGLNTFFIVILSTF